MWSFCYKSTQLFFHYLAFSAEIVSADTLFHYFVNIANIFSGVTVFVITCHRK